MKKLLLLLLIFPALSQAQVAGYLGKRLVVGYSNYFMFGLRGPGPSNASASDNRSPTINNVNCLNLEYAFSNSRMICLSGQYQRTGVAYSDGTTNGTLAADFFGTSSDYPYPENHKYTGSFAKPALLTSTNIAVSLKTFRRGFLAPLGTYRKMEVIVFLERIRYDKEKFAIPDQSGSSFTDTEQSDLGTGDYKYRNFAFAYSFGKTRALADKFLLDYGIRFAYCPALNIVNFAAGEELTSNTFTYFRRESNIRIAKAQLVNIHIGIGFLAY